MKLHESFKNNDLGNNYPIFRENSVERIPKQVDLVQHFVVPWEMMEDGTKRWSISRKNGQFISDWFLPFAPE